MILWIHRRYAAPKRVSKSVNRNGAFGCLQHDRLPVLACSELKEFGRELKGHAEAGKLRLQSTSSYVTLR